MRRLRKPSSPVGTPTTIEPRQPSDTTVSLRNLEPPSDLGHICPESPKSSRGGVSVDDGASLRVAILSPLKIGRDSVGPSDAIAVRVLQSDSEEIGAGRAPLTLAPTAPLSGDVAVADELERLGLFALVGVGLGVADLLAGTVVVARTGSEPGIRSRGRIRARGVVSRIGRPPISCDARIADGIASIRGVRRVVRGHTAPLSGRGVDVGAALAARTRPTRRTGRDTLSRSRTAQITESTGGAVARALTGRGVVRARLLDDTSAVVAALDPRRLARGARGPTGAILAIAASHTRAGSIGVRSIADLSPRTVARQLTRHGLAPRRFVVVIRALSAADESDREKHDTRRRPTSAR